MRNPSGQVSYFSLSFPFSSFMYRNASSTHVLIRPHSNPHISTYPTKPNTITMSKEPATFTARDFELLAGAMTCTKAPLEVDYKKFVFRDSASAKASWDALMKKL
jgi:hypothetical protein